MEPAMELNTSSEINALRLLGQGISKSGCNDGEGSMLHALQHTLIDGYRIPPNILEEGGIIQVKEMALQVSRSPYPEVFNSPVLS